MSTGGTHLIPRQEAFLQRLAAKEYDRQRKLREIEYLSDVYHGYGGIRGEDEELLDRIHVLVLDLLHHG